MLCHHMRFVPNAQTIPKQIIAFRIGGKAKCSTSFKMMFPCFVKCDRAGGSAALSVACLLGGMPLKNDPI